MTRRRITEGINNNGAIPRSRTLAILLINILSFSQCLAMPREGKIQNIPY
jgi:hypothetical protein